MKKDSVVLLEQVRTIDKIRLDDFVGIVSQTQMNKVEDAFRTSTGVKKLDRPLVMCLCPICAKPFYESNDHFIKRADKDQVKKEICMFCNSKLGFDYLIRRKLH